MLAARSGTVTPPCQNPGTRPSPAGPPRVALCGQPPAGPPAWGALPLEGGGTLAGVLGGTHRFADLPLPVELLGRRPLGCLDDDPLARRDGERAVRGDRAGQGQRLVERAALRGQPVDQADL